MTDSQGLNFTKDELEGAWVNYNNVKGIVLSVEGNMLHVKTDGIKWGRSSIDKFEDWPLNDTKIISIHQNILQMYI